MSDGPYKSLPMRPSWRRAAKCVYKEAFSQDDIVESVTRASHADWRAEVRPSLVTSVTAAVVHLGQQTLFADQTLMDLATRSCWQGARHVSFKHKRRQCGICAACMLRRLSMHAANVEEPATNYIWEDLSVPEIEEGAVAGFTLMTPSLREHAIAGVLHFDHLASLSASAIHRRSVARVARETADALRMSSTEAEAYLLALLAQHRAEWLAFQKSLGPQSFVAKLAQVSPWHR